MTKVAVVFEYEEPEYCRLCLSERSEKNCLTPISLARTSVKGAVVEMVRDLLQIELDPTTESGSLICSTCLTRLEEFHQYQSSCKDKDKTLKEKIQERKQKQIELAKNAIETTNVLDQINDGGQIKVIIRMNAEGKTSVRLQVQTKPAPAVPPQPPPAQPPSVTDDTPSTSKQVEETQSQAKTKQKMIRLAYKPFYFYRTPSTGHGLIYGGYRYYGSFPRKNHTHWVCEQRKNSSCTAILSVDKSYDRFWINFGHSHPPPKVHPDMAIYKSKDILASVIENEKVRENQLMRKKFKPNEDNYQQESILVSEVHIKDEPEDSDDETPSMDEEEDSQDGVTVLSDSNMEEEDIVYGDSNSSFGPTHVEVEAEETMYIIQELT